MATERIKKIWETYRAILPKDASANQIIETRRAFYAGADALFVTILNLLEPGAEATDNDLKMLDEIQKEFNDFAELIKNGVA